MLKKIVPEEDDNLIIQFLPLNSIERIKEFDSQLVCDKAVNQFVSKNKYFVSLFKKFLFRNIFSNS